jgi:3'-phosphoadenosine 5'-phosphosulfate sulfotransferase (PAPS reductase)/FAD synthetase
MHVDTGKKFAEMYAFRDRFAVEWDLDLKVEQCPPIDVIDPTLPPAARSAARKTEGLKLALAKYGFDGLIAGIRRDEEPTRAKERVFSPRGLEGGWDVRDQPPEFWDQFNASPPPGAHLRIHPILHWTELDIWAYTRREGIPIIPLYLARDGKRYRSLGDADITFPVQSHAATIDDVITELRPREFLSVPAERWITKRRTRSSAFALLATSNRHWAKHDHERPCLSQDRVSAHRQCPPFGADRHRRPRRSREINTDRPAAA